VHEERREQSTTLSPSTATLSYNCLFNFIYGIRGAGKTYTGLQHYVSVLNAALLGSADYNRLSHQ
jgi:hypothetical protein